MTHEATKATPSLTFANGVSLLESLLTLTEVSSVNVDANLAGSQTRVEGGALTLVHIIFTRGACGEREVRGHV